MNRDKKKPTRKLISYRNCNSIKLIRFENAVLNANQECFNETKTEKKKRKITQQKHPITVLPKQKTKLQTERECGEREVLKSISSSDSNSFYILDTVSFDL